MLRLTAATLLVVAAVIAMQWWRSLNSWILAPGLVVGALPTMTQLVVDVDGLTRWLFLLVCGAAVAVVGGRLRLAGVHVPGHGIGAARSIACDRIGPLCECGGSFGAFAPLAA